MSHELATELAQAVISEVEGAPGDEAADMLESSNLLRQMSRGFSTGHAAKVARKAVESTPEVHASLPITLVDVGLEAGHPCIMFSDFLATLADMDKMEILTAGADLRSFWEKMQPLKPHHPVYKLSAEDLAFTIPIYLIGDEGRGYKKSAVFVLGSEPVLGSGCEAEDERTAAEPLRMNYRGNSIVTRQLFSVMPRTTYLRDSTPLHKLVSAWAEDLAKCFTTGLEVRRGGTARTWRVVTLGLKGDWPALDKLGRLSRHFRRESSPFGVGICHLCMANTRGCPSWHECDLNNAPWVRSMAETTDPWKRRMESGLTSLIPMDANKKRHFYYIDLFHTLHKGVAADLAGSALELILHSNYGFETLQAPTKP